MNYQEENDKLIMSHMNIIKEEAKALEKEAQPKEPTLFGPEE